MKSPGRFLGIGTEAQLFVKPHCRAVVLQAHWGNHIYSPQTFFSKSTCTENKYLLLIAVFVNISFFVIWKYALQFHWKHFDKIQKKIEDLENFSTGNYFKMLRSTPINWRKEFLLSAHSKHEMKTKFKGYRNKATQNGDQVLKMWFFGGFLRSSLIIHNTWIRK